LQLDLKLASENTRLSWENQRMNSVTVNRW